MIAYNNALSILEEIASSRKFLGEDVLLSNAMGRILAASVESPENIPSFTNSAMDGFAVFSSDTMNATIDCPVEIPVRGMIAAGDIQAFERACVEKQGIGIEIMTGAPIPTGGHDAVVRIEDVELIYSIDRSVRSIKVRKPIKSGDNIRPIGTDYLIGQEVLREGLRLAPEHILACASLGIQTLRVKRRPRVAIVSTGSELVIPETSSLLPGMIRNSTAPFLKAALDRLGVDAHCFGIVSDDPERYQNTIEEALRSGFDIIVSTGAVSMGKFDFVPEVLKTLKANIYFHKVAIRPGKPILFADLNNTRSGSVFFGLPGNPISTAVGLRFFVEPYLRSALGLPREQPINANLSRDCPKPIGLRCFFKAKTKMRPDGGIEVESLRGQSSYVVSTLMDANCWVVLADGGDRAEASSRVEVYPLHNSFERGVIL